MNNKDKKHSGLIITVILVLIVNNIAQYISGLNKNWTLLRFIIFMFVTYVIFLFIKKLYKLLINNSK